MQLKNEKLILRNIVQSDLPYYYEWRNNKNIFKFLGGGYHPVSKEEMNDIFTFLLSDNKQNKRFTIEVDSIPVGMIGLYKINEIQYEAEVGLYIGSEKYQNRGYATKAYKLLEKYAEAKLMLTALKIFVVKDNHQAVKFWKRNMFKEIKTLINDRKIDSKLYDVIIMKKKLNF
ncbi:GNAT family N-acetyltransferase [Mycoplasmatota bacterium]|nr:GNAT family N-acetyltransferase [Mycoplasmatota bacterium]